MIRKVLIANRGEIAVRIIRACKELGLSTVAVYSEADEKSLHVELATQAVCIGGSRATDSYLNMDNIIQAACNTGCDAIHPGFGFLSENSKFVRLVEECGLIFIGPKASIIEMLGNKAEARKLMSSVGVPIIPGSKDIISDAAQGITQAKDIGYPVIVKASNGGGGRGMRIISKEDDFAQLFDAAKSEAKVCFGDDEMYLEKYIENPKHIEVQIIGDNFGNVIHLFERDCSFQRRNQKLIEEAPCRSLNQDIRDALFESAIKACKSVSYNSVGTIEFLVDKHGEYYFMEMNTRIQVEHPITEMISGVDIVKQQIRIADNQALSIEQSDIKCNGYALECRINAEDIRKDFVPDPGTITFLHLPGGKGVRIDSAVYNGYTISPFYDSMILKLITFASTRLGAIKKMRVALEELIIEGPKNNIEFHYLAMHHPKFVEGKYDTKFCELFVKELKENGEFI
ncbi:MAG: acetyl-CoA carboxylase biotin carboxylase subunit [Anaerorhabdus sp.]